ncbi:MAG: hypothetical protein JWP34_2573 [Massilia sp.]|nr:hypothetical protein [Massilia sp.]
MSLMNKRRSLMLGLLAAPLVSSWPGLVSAADDKAAVPADNAPGRRLSRWTPGCLDIHHIATGRGNATLVLMPDGTSLLIDAGATADGLDVSVPTRPTIERRAGEWIGRYVLRHLAATGRSGLDYMLLTHLHPDHLGDIAPGQPTSVRGDYRLTGIMDVAEMLPIGTLIDRGFPAYDYPAPQTAAFATNYLAFVRSRVARGEPVERFRVGSGGQIRQRGRGPAGARFEVRNLIASGEVWTGQGDATRQLFPPLSTLAARDYPNENLCSAGIRIALGNFAYFTAGDLTSYTYDGEQPWRDALTAAARAAGPVDVATADHHGLFDGLSADTVRTLRPRAWVIPGWHISHPDLLQLERMFSERLYPGPRDVFATTVMEENLRANHRLARRMRSTDGHVVVRVAPDGASFRVAVTDNRDEQDRVKLVTGPYASGPKNGRV